MKTSSTFKKFFFKHNVMEESDPNNFLIAEEARDNKYYDINNTEYNKDEITIIREIDTDTDIGDEYQRSIALARINSIFIMLLGTERFDIINNNNANLEFNIHYPLITMQDEYGHTTEVNDLFVRFNSLHSLGELNGRRLTMPQSQIETCFTSSHKSYNNFRYSYFCLGKSELGGALGILDTMTNNLSGLNVVEEDIYEWYNLISSLDAYLSWENSGDCYSNMNCINKSKIDGKKPAAGLNLSVERYNSDISGYSSANKLRPSFNRLPNRIYTVIDAERYAEDVIADSVGKDFSKREMYTLLTSGNSEPLNKLLFKKYASPLDIEYRRRLKALIELYYIVEDGKIVNVNEQYFEENKNYIKRILSGPLVFKHIGQIMNVNVSSTSSGDRARLLNERTDTFIKSFRDQPMIFKGNSIEHKIITDLIEDELEDAPKLSLEAINKLYDIIKDGNIMITNSDVERVMNNSSFMYSELTRFRKGIIAKFIHKTI